VRNLALKLFNVDLIEERIETWFSLEQRIVIEPKDSSIKYIEVFSTPSREMVFSGCVDLSDFPEIWVKILSQSLRDNIFNISDTFVRLLGLGVTLKWKGLLSKRAAFVTNPALRELSRYVPSLKVKSRLADVLNHNSGLLDKIDLVKPEWVDVKLAFISPIQKSKMDLSRLRLEYFKDPNEIIWKINVGFSLNRTFSQWFNKPKALGLIDMMNLIASDVLDTSRQQVMDLGS